MELERENKRLKLLIIILLVFLVAFVGYYFYINVIKGNDKNIPDDKEVINDIITSKGNDDTNSQIKNIKIEEIKDLFKFGYSYYESPSVYCGKSDHTLVNIYGTEKYASTEFSTYEEMINSLKKYMSVEVIAGKPRFAATTKEYYLEQDNKLYCEETYKGYMYDYGNIEIEIISQNDNKVTCTATMELIDPSNNKTYDKVDLILEENEGNFIITSYNKQNQN